MEPEGQMIPDHCQAILHMTRHLHHLCRRPSASIHLKVLADQASIVLPHHENEIFAIKMLSLQGVSGKRCRGRPRRRRGGKVNCLGAWVKEMLAGGAEGLHSCVCGLST